MYKRQEDKADKKEEEEDKSSSIASKPENDTSKPKQENPKQEKPKQENSKQENPKQEKPKEEKPKQPKLQPKPEPKPGNNLPTPPPGATLIMELPQGEMYSYNKNLSGGGSVTTAGTSRDANGKFISISMEGTDSNGTSMAVTYNPSTDKFTHNMGRYTFTPEAENAMRDIARTFMRAYGY